jgi:hypothetical protein
MSEGHSEWVFLAGQKKLKPINLNECTHCLHFPEMDVGVKYRTNGSNSEVGPGNKNTEKRLQL